jgi:CRISPR-associated endonuclease/helicase Cas3
MSSRTDGTAGVELFAHSLPDPDVRTWEPLPKHLGDVAHLTARFARHFGCESAGWVMGALHDAGKASPAFQKYIRAKGPSPDHSTAGAVAALQHYGDVWGRLMAFGVAGHHAGLANGSHAGGDLTPLRERLSDHPPVPLPAGVELPDPSAVRRSIKDRSGFSRAFLARMLFSCLIDADRLATKAFYAKAQGDRVEPGCLLDLKTLRDRLTAHMAAKAAGLDQPLSSVNALRARVLDTVVSRAALPPGLFSLTVPTGGGKTLASLAFALNHALNHATAHGESHGMRRVIYVIPFTSIVEQTADTFREALGSFDAVLEHHSNYDPETDHRDQPDDEGADGGRKLRLAAENWDRPVVVTTAVQFFESLFSNRIGRCRKLHNIAGSVVVLDEAQTLPLKFLRPCLEAVRELAQHYRCSVVLCTATQPAVLAPTEQKPRGFRDGLKDVRELAPDPIALYQELKRVTVTRVEQPLGVAALAERLTEAPQVLCIVNSRRHARDLYRVIREQPGARLLTTSLCGAHRRAVLAEIRKDLEHQRPVRLVATSLIEAGVDISFPVVYRAEAGLDSIAQAAGRCNRHGELGAGAGQVFVFKPEDAERHKPPAELKQFAETARGILGRHADPLSLDAIEDYFGELYWLHDGHGTLDGAMIGKGANAQRGILPSLNDMPKSLDFRFADIAAAFRIIDDVQAPVIVPYGPAAEEIDELVNDLQFVKTPGAIARKLQPYVVQIPRRERQRLIEAGAAEFIRPKEFGDQFVLLNNKELYDQQDGLNWDDPSYRSVEGGIF